MTAVVEVTRVVDVDLKALAASRVAAREPDLIPPAPYLVVDAATGGPVAYCAQAPDDLTRDVVNAFRAVKRSTVLRAAGIRSASNTFGYGAPNALIQRTTPTATAWAIEDPDGHRSLERFAAWAWGHLREHGPGTVVDTLAAARDRVHPDWRLGDSPWTSGIGNDNVNLRYHTDRNNVPHAWSVMLAARAGMAGGNLHIADYDLTVPVRDRSAFYFPGVDLMHGVTPMTPRIRGAFRYTFVWYPVRRFVDLPGAAEAITTAQQRRTVLEGDQVARQRAAGHIKDGA